MRVFGDEWPGHLERMERPRFVMICATCCKYIAENEPGIQLPHVALEQDEPVCRALYHHRRCFLRSLGLDIP